MNIILASSSPRRKELFRLIQEDFTCLPVSIDENSEEFSSPRDYVMEMARRKAETVAIDHPTSCVIGCDTIVELEGKILGKPKNKADAFDMLKAMSGKKHTVLTSVVLCSGKRQREELFEAQVHFFELEDEEIQAYITTENVYDKAGSYGIQGNARLFVKEIHGTQDTIVGFPVAHVKRMLEEFFNV